MNHFNHQIQIISPREYRIEILDKMVQEEHMY